MNVTTFTIGVYTVHARPRQDNPGWLVYLVYRGSSLIGKSFSVPDLGCCRWLETSNGVYASSSTMLRVSEGKTRRGGQVLKCEHCGSSVYRRPSELHMRFCSHACANKHHEVRRGGEYVSCAQCGKGNIYREPWQMKRLSKLHFCSAQCAGAHRRKNP